MKFKNLIMGALLAAGLYANAMWLIPLIGLAAGAGIAAFKLKRNH